MTQFDLDGYLSRIGWDESRQPTFETLATLLRAHMMRIPFENLDVLLGRGVRLDLDTLYGKLVLARRGGYCYEHATLFQAVLRHLGFEPVAHAARVVMATPRTDAPRTHMFLSVLIGSDTFVLDPGFGGHAPIVPVPLVAGAQVRDGNDVHRMVRRDDEWTLETDIGGAAVPLWSSSLEPQYPVDFVMANHFVSTFPDSPFVTGLRLRALTDEGRVSVMNRDVTIVQGDRKELAILPDRSTLRALLTQFFGFDLPAVERLRVPSVTEWL